jgi:hypothetical protein
VLLLLAIWSRGSGRVLLAFQGGLRFGLELVTAALVGRGFD